MGIFQIPGNIKQQWLPFTLNPGADINKSHKKGELMDSSKNLQGVTDVQVFSFRNKESKSYKAGFGRLNICPSAFTSADFSKLISQDVSFQTLYGDLNKSGRTSSPLAVDDILNNLPGIQIREFLPDTKLDQCINMFSEIMMEAFSAAKDLISGGSDSDSGASSSSKEAKTTVEPKNPASPSWMKKIKAVLLHAFDYYTGVATPNNVYNNFSSNSSKYGNNSGLYVADSSVTSDSAKILNFPFTLYYRLQSCVTTGIYELPCKTDDDLLYSSQGSKGWTGGSNSIGFGNSFISKIPIVGDFLKNILGNIQINFMPWWDASSGSQTPPPEVSLKFDLFNDTADAAMFNFIFVNTLIPDNMWIQYGMFQHSPHLYDVKLEGYNRLFACAGDFSVKAKGVMRNPSPEFIKTLCDKYYNVQANKTTAADAFIKNGIIRIPDVYEVSLKFTSLLPLNFNNFLFSYSNNQNIETEYIGQSVYQEGELKNVMKSLTTGFISDMKDFINDKNGAMTKKISEMDSGSAE